MAPSFEAELTDLISKACTHGADIRGAYDIETPDGDCYTVEITEISTE
jgi:hypothetical protein